MHLNDIAEQATATAVEKGFHPQIVLDNMGRLEDPLYIATRLALIHSEVSEALAEVRTKPLPKDAFAAELADTIIRIGDLAYIMGIDLDLAVEDKMAYNKTRAFQHGGRTL